MRARAGGGPACWLWFALVGGIFAPAVAGAQTAGVAPLTINDAIQLALRNYPAIKESRARAQAAAEEVGVARTAYLPRLDMLWQENRATTNNVFGFLFPQSTIGPISGPVLGTRSFNNSVWGSAAGLLLSWDAVDFGQRSARVDEARARSARANAETTLTELDVASAAADVFLRLLAADETVRATRANVDRLQVFSDAVRTLVQNQLRPGADESRAEAELARAKNELSQATEAADVARASLADAIGAAGTSLEVTVGSLQVLPALTTESGDLTSHPAARAGQAAVDVARARERALEHAYYPKVTLLSGLAGRGTGARVPGLPSVDYGPWLQVPNWAIGGQVTFAAFDFFSIDARKRVEVQNALAETARFERTIQQLTTADAKARALMKAAQEIASNTPIELQAATAGESQARARYRNGLASVTEVAEAQRLLAQAEADAALARLAVWRALLAAAVARGDLSSFLEQIKRR